MNAYHQTVAALTKRIWPGQRIVWGWCRASGNAPYFVAPYWDNPCEGPIPYVCASTSEAMLSQLQRIASGR
jgi:hypothetical protein